MIKTTHQVKFYCNCVVEYTTTVKSDNEIITEFKNKRDNADICKIHYSPTMFIKPHQDKSNYTLVSHEINEHLYLAIHKCKKDNLGFITKLKQRALTGLIAANTSQEEQVEYFSSVILKNITEENLISLIKDLYCNMKTFPKHLLY